MGSELKTVEDVLRRAAPEPNTGCWLWMGAVNSAGYASVRHGGRVVQAHRLVCELTHGTLGERVARHSCDQPLCVNPAHLVPGTQSDNANDRERRGRGFHRTQPERQVRCSSHPMSKLKIFDVLCLRQMWLTGEFSQRQVAQAFGLSQSTVSNIVNNKTEWSMLWGGAL